MTELAAERMIWAAGCIHAGIVLTNAVLPQRLKVRENLASTPVFVRQIFYVHWIYIVFIVGFFGTLCFGFAHDLAGASRLGRFVSAFISGFWLLRFLNQLFYYDRDVRRANGGLDLVYLLGLAALAAIFGWVAVMRRG